MGGSVKNAKRLSLPTIDLVGYVSTLSRLHPPYTGKSPSIPPSASLDFASARSG